MNNFVLFLVCLAIGVGLGATYGVLNFVKMIFKNNIIISNILNFVFGVGCGIVALLATINLNFGQFRWFIVLGFVLGVIIERKTLGKLFAKIFLWLYNKFSKWISALKNTKVVKKILKWEMEKL